MKLSKRTINNLNKLADFLDTLPKEKFHMGAYRSNKAGHTVEYYSKSDCGTVGCALGWAPFVPGLEPKSTDLLQFSPTLSFMNYSLRIFKEVKLDTDAWDFMFSGIWASNKFENTPQATANRIRIVASGAFLLGYNEIF